MPSCSICLDDLKAPVSLPCGHIFCSECLFRTVNAIKPYSSVHFCPTCRAVYSIVNIDPSLVPSHLRQHIVPCVRRLYIDEPEPASESHTPTMNPDAAVIECRRLTAENNSLKVNCGLWRKRAEVHAAATLGLLNLARMTRDEAIRMKRERDDLSRQCEVLKRKFEAEQAFSQSAPPSISNERSKCNTPPSPVLNGLSMEHTCSLHSRQALLLPAQLHCVPCTQQWLGIRSSSCAPQLEVPEQNLGPSLKRRKVAAPTSVQQAEEPRSKLLPRRSPRTRIQS